MSRSFQLGWRKLAVSPQHMFLLDSNERSRKTSRVYEASYPKIAAHLSIVNQSAGPPSYSCTCAGEHCSVSEARFSAAKVYGRNWGFASARILSEARFSAAKVCWRNWGFASARILSEARVSAAKVYGRNWGFASARILSEARFSAAKVCWRNWDFASAGIFSEARVSAAKVSAEVIGKAFGI